MVKIARQIKTLLLQGMVALNNFLKNFSAKKMF